MPTPSSGIHIHQKQRIRAPAPNDDFARRIDLPLSVAAWDADGNSRQTGEPTPTVLSAMSPVGAPKQTVWFKYKAKYKGKLYLSALKSKDSMGGGLLGGFMAAYSGSTLTGLTERKSTQWFTGTGGDLHYERLTVRMKKGEVRVLQIGAIRFPSVVGDDDFRAHGEYQLTIAYSPPPADDEQASPTTLSGGTGTLPTWDPGDYFSSDGEPVGSSGGANNTRWLAWTAPTTGDYDFIVGGGGIFTLWQGTTEIGSGTGTVTLGVVAGQGYTIQIGTATEVDVGSITFSWRPHTSFSGDFYVSFDVTFDAIFTDYNQNGNIVFVPSCISMDGNSPSFGWEGQGFGAVKNENGAGNPTVFTWMILFSNSGGFRFGPVIVPGTTYHIDLFFEGIDTITVKIDGTTYGPFDYTGTFDSDGFPNAFFTRLEFGAEPMEGTYSNMKGTMTLDNVKVGTTAYGSSELFSHDFDDGNIVPPFDSKVDTASEMSVVSSKISITFPGSGASANAYAIEDLAV